MKMEKKNYIKPTVTIIAYGHFCDSDFGNWGSGVEDGAGKATDFDEDGFDEDGFNGFSFGNGEQSFYNPSSTMWE